MRAGEQTSNILSRRTSEASAVNSYEKMGKIIAEYAAKIVNEKKEIESDERVHRELNELCVV